MSNKFKVGDKVRVIHGESTPWLNWLNGMAKYIGSEFEVKSITDEGNYDLSGMGYHMHESWLELAENKYNTGDLVQIVKGESIEGGCQWVSPHMDKYVGHVGVITDEGTEVLPNYKVNNIDWYFHKTWLKPFEFCIFDGFKVGDRVICKVDNKYATTNENTVCEVTAVYDSVITLKTTSGEMHDEQNKNVYKVFSEDFKLLSRKPKPDTSKGDEICEGDMVICSGDHEYCYTGSSTLCKVVDICHTSRGGYINSFVSVVTGLGKFRMVENEVEECLTFPVDMSHFEKVYTGGKFEVGSIVTNNNGAVCEVLGHLKSGDMLVKLIFTPNDRYIILISDTDFYKRVHRVNPEQYKLLNVPNKVCTATKTSHPDTSCSEDTQHNDISGLEKKTETPKLKTLKAKTLYSQHLPRSEQTTPELIGECISLVKQMDRMKERLHNKRDFLKGNIEEINSRTGIDITRYVKELDGVIV